MGFNLLKAIGVTFDLEVEAPRTGHPGLPEVSGLIIFLGVEGGVTEIFQQQQGLLVKGLLDSKRRLHITAREVRSGSQPHCPMRLFFLARSLPASLWSEAINSSCVANGPK